MPLYPNSTSTGTSKCLLSLDAGGGRGISQLRILEELMRRLSKDTETCYPCAVFDMIGGTGSGGFIAILLVVFGLTAKQASDEFTQLAVDILDCKEHDAKARTRLLEDYIKNLLKKHEFDMDMLLMNANSRSNGCKLIVPVCYKQNINSTYIIRNFSVRDEQALNVTVVEALRASLATPPLFSPISISKDATTFDYIGGDITLSNPTQELLAEAYKAFGSEESIACFVSLGCGHPGIISICDDSDSTGRDHVSGKVTNCEQKHQDIGVRMGHLGLYYRFSVKRGLGETTSTPTLGEILTHTETYLADVDEAPQIGSFVGSLESRNGLETLGRLMHVRGQSPLPQPPPPLTGTFVMREQPWLRIKEALLGTRNGPVDRPRMLAVTGIGGCGKTQIILYFMHKHQSEFMTQIFIDGSSRGRIQADMVRGVRSLGTEHCQKTFDESLLFLAQPSRDGPRLVLYDNVDDPELDLVPLLPKGDGCVIILTSRNRSIGGLCPHSHLELGVMSEEEAIQLLLSTPDAAVTSENQARQDARGIAQALGCLPIALTQARSYMYETRCSSGEYLKLLTSSQHKANLLADRVKYQQDMRYKPTYAAFNASFQRLVPHNQRLLRLLSCFHWTDFPLPLFGFAAGYNFIDYECKYIEHGNETQRGRTLLEEIFYQDGEWSEMNLNEMAKSLQSYSLVTIVNRYGTRLLQMHPLLHEWVQSGIPQNDRPSNQSAAVLLLALGARTEHSSLAQYLPSHVMHLSSIWEQLHINNAGAFGLILNNGGIFNQALPLRERVVTELRKRSDMDGVMLSSSLWSLASTYRDLGRYEDAAIHLLKVIDSRTNILGEGHMDTLKASGSLAAVYFEMGRYEEAEELETEVLRLRKETVGDLHPDTISASANLAATYHQRGRYGEAERLQMEVLELRKATLGGFHPDTISTSANLAATYGELGRYEEGEKLAKEVLKLRKKTVGDLHPDTISASGNLADTYNKLGRYAEAEKLGMEALGQSKDIGRFRHLDTIIIILNLAETYEKMGKKRRALQLIMDAEAILSEIANETHPYYKACQEIKSRVQALEGGAPALCAPNYDVDSASPGDLFSRGPVQNLFRQLTALFCCFKGWFWKIFVPTITFTRVANSS